MQNEPGLRIHTKSYIRNVTVNREVNVSRETIRYGAISYYNLLLTFVASALSIQFNLEFYIYSILFYINFLTLNIIILKRGNK